MLYVLDEPSVGLHPRDVERLIGAIIGLRDRGNTVVVVEHEEAMIRAADQVIEIGPGAGERGGEVVFQGTPAEMHRLGSQSDRRFSGRPARHPGKSSAADAQPRLDSAGRRARQQSEKSDGRIPARPAVRGHRRQRRRQEHAGPGHALSGPAAADARGRGQAAGLRRRVRRRAIGRRDDGRSEPDRPFAALESGDLHQGLRRDPRRVCRNGRSPDAQFRRGPLQLQRRRRPLHDVRRRRLSAKSTCSSWPTSI